MRLFACFFSGNECWLTVSHATAFKNSSSDCPYLAACDLGLVLSETLSTPMLSLLYSRGPHDGEVSAVNDIQAKETGFRMSDLETITINPPEDDTNNKS